MIRVRDMAFERRDRVLCLLSRHLEDELGRLDFEKIHVQARYFFGRGWIRDGSGFFERLNEFLIHLIRQQTSFDAFFHWNIFLFQGSLFFRAFDFFHDRIRHFHHRLIGDP